MTYGQIRAELIANEAELKKIKLMTDSQVFEYCEAEKSHVIAEIEYEISQLRLELEEIESDFADANRFDDWYDAMKTV